MDVFGKITAILMSLVLFFGWPLVYIQVKQDELADMYIMHETVKFVRDVRIEGAVSQERYDRYIEQLSACGKFVHVETEEENGWLTVRVSNGLVYGGEITNETN